MSWNDPFIGELTKQQIRDISKEIYPNSIFATPSSDVKKNCIEIELSNASEKYCLNELGEIFANRLSDIAKIPIKFEKYKFRTETVDLHEFEPTKISRGTYEKMTTAFIVFKLKS